MAKIDDEGESKNDLDVPHVDSSGQDEDDDEDDNEEQVEDDENDENEDDERQEDESGEEDEDDSSSSEEESLSEDESDDEDSKPAAAGASELSEDGHQLSAYELQRLERIRRNKEYLASLGLEEEKARLQKPSAPKKRKKGKPKPELKRRSSISRRTKAKEINYSGVPHARWENDAPGDDGDKKPIAPLRTKHKESHGKKGHKQRMERFIYNEFQRIQADVKRDFKRTKRNLREADVAYRYAKIKADRYERKKKRELETKKFMAENGEELKVLGCTAKQMLQQLDSRMWEVQQSLRAFDERFQRQGNMAQWNAQHEENTRKMEIIDALERFPRALKYAVQDLDLLLIERSPRDPPAPRKSTRKRKSVEGVEEPETPEAEISAVETPDISKERITDGSWGGLSAAITAETLSTAITGKASPEPSPSEVDLKPAVRNKKRELVAKNVGGWVSPVFSQSIDRNWLESDSPPKKFDPSRYIPQIGDTVLYYPSGHQSFLQVNPDILGKKTRNITRLTLWDRAKKEKAKTKKASADEADKKAPAQESEGKEVPKWWSDEWLATVEGDLGRYPIVCRVEKTHIEFPNDPYAEDKIVTKDGGSVHVTYAVKKESQQNKRSTPPLCLAVMLHPLTPVVPPRAAGANADDEQLALAPNFYVVTFPSKVSPFIIPFSMAYRLSHSISTGDAVRLLSKPEWQGAIKNFRSLNSVYGSGRLEDKIGSIRALCAALRAGPNSFAKSLEDALSTDSSATIPIVDACCVVERFEAVLGGSATDANRRPGNEESNSLVDVIRSTLPLWKEVVVESVDGKKIAASSWELAPLGSSTNARAGPLQSLSADVEIATGLVYTIDEPLRAKIEFTIEDFVKSTPDSSMFGPLVTDNVAPSYSCAVPRSMAFDKVVRRLKFRKASSDGVARCYYRTVDSLLSDISAIADNCVLYNSPDSFVVQKVMEIIPELKRLIAQVASRHFKEKESREKLVEERRKAILLQCNTPALLEDTKDVSESASRSHGKRETLQPPYKEPLRRSWVQGTHPDGSWRKDFDFPNAAPKTHSTSSDNPQQRQPRVEDWVPQSGDTILYSRSLHSDFVKAHHPSLLTEQCTLPRFTGEGDGAQQSPEVAATPGTALSDDLQTRWLVGKVVWARSSFPRARTKCDPDYENTFEEASPILSIGIRFNYNWSSSVVHVVHWRPCLFSNDFIASDDNASSTSSPQTESAVKQQAGAIDLSLKTVARKTCLTCHLSADQSFVCPAWIPIAPVAAHPEDEKEEKASPYLIPDGPLPPENWFASPLGLSNDYITSIDRCLDVLKRRCLEEVPPDHLDSKFTKDNVKRGWTPVAPSGKRLPSFERILAKANTSGKEVATRGVEKVDRRAVALLADSHFLPLWTFSLSEGAQHKTNRDGIAESLSLHETLSPTPNLCLELIQQRVRDGYYRGKASVAHDIQEAYVSSVLLLLAKPATAKKGKVSIRRIAKGLSCKESCSLSHADGKKVAKSIAALNEEERTWVEKINRVRMLYGTALLCAIETACMEKIFGTVPKRKSADVETEQEPLSERDRIFMDARNKLGYIFACLQRDPCTNRPSRSSLTPSVRVSVSFSGQEASPDVQARTEVDRAKAAKDQARREYERRQFGDPTSSSPPFPKMRHPGSLVQERTRRVYFTANNEKPSTIAQKFRIPAGKIVYDNRELHGSELLQSSRLRPGTVIVLPLEKDVKTTVSDGKLRWVETLGGDDATSTTVFETNCVWELGRAKLNGAIDAKHVQETPCPSSGAADELANTKDICGVATLGPHENPNHSGFEASAIPQGNVMGSDVTIDAPESDYDTTKPLLFEHKDYEFKESLSSLFFRSSGRSSTCARCSATGRSFLTCRVYRRHCLPDFNWVDTFRGVCGLNGLLHMLRYGERLHVPEFDRPLNSIVVGDTGGAQPTSIDGNGIKDSAEGTSDEKDEPDPSVAFEKSKVALVLANRLFEKARKAAEAPIRLSEEFIASYFPVDQSDGHYNYCTICGLSGDVICCEGCPNVSHPHCLNLKEIPEDDWFCHKCTRKSRSTKAESKKDQSAQCEPQKISDVSLGGSAGAEATDGVVDPERNSDQRVDESPPADSSEEVASGPPKEDLHGEAQEECKIDQGIADSQKVLFASTSIDGTESKDDVTNEEAQVIPAPPHANASVCDELVVLSQDAAADDETCRLESILNELKQMRPMKRMPKKGKGEKAQDPSVSIEAQDEDDAEAHEKIPLTVVVGMKVKKAFGSYGDYAGTITHLPTTEHLFYRVEYEDGDEEDLEEVELRKLLEDTESRRSQRGSRKSAEPAEEDSDEVFSEGTRKRRRLGTSKRHGRPPGSVRKREAAKPLDGDAINILSDVARSFLGTQSITTAEAFLSTRTNDLAKPLIKWRKEQKMPALKGSGPVATISGWKTRVRDLIAESDDDDEDACVSKVVQIPRSPRIRQTKSLDGDAYNALTDVARSFLGTQQITSADAFLSAKTAGLANDLIKWRKQQRMPALKGTGAIATISGWKGVVRKAAASMGKEGGNVDDDDASDAKELAAPPAARKKRGRAPKDPEPEGDKINIQELLEDEATDSPPRKRGRPRRYPA